LTNKQIQIIIFYDADSCVCSSEYLLEKVGKIASRSKDVVDFNLRSTASEEARQYLIRESCVLVNGTIKLNPDFEEEELTEAIIECLNEL